MFPIRFASPVALATSWVDAGRPAPSELVPIFTRNIISARLGSYTGALIIEPRQIDVILVDGVESPLGEERDGWSSEDDCLNPAEWPEGQESLALLRQETIDLCCGVDPATPRKIAAAIDSFGVESSTVRGVAAPGQPEVRRVRVETTIHKAWVAYCSELSPETGELVYAWDRQAGELRRLPDGRVVHSRSGWMYGQYRSIIRVVGREVHYLDLSGVEVRERVALLPEKVYCERSKACPSSGPGVKYCPGHAFPAVAGDDNAYAEGLAAARACIAAARAAAEAAPLLPEFPAHRARVQQRNGTVPLLGVGA